MRITFWGTRGSIAVPGPDTVRYGGNTSCLEVLCDGGERIILDAGTGIRALGLQLSRSMPVDCAVFISHTHWDHIQGLPFFVPLFVPGNTISIHGTFDPIAMKDIREILAGQMNYNYFPVRSVELAANITYVTLRDGQAVQIGAATVTPFLMNHTVVTFGYKVESQGKAMFYTGDHEDYANIYAPEDVYYQEYEELIRSKRSQLTEFIRGVDVLVADAQYTEEEYPAKFGWGHSTPDRCVALAQSAGVKRLFITHHEPTRDDDALTLFLAETRRDNDGSGVEIRLAAEGVSVEV